MRMQENDSIYDLDYSHPANEDIWDIDSNTRRVYIPPQFRGIAGVEGDHYAEILTFRIDRYFDGVDLSEKTCIVQFLNPGGKGGTYQIQKFDTTSEPGKILFQWAIDNVATQYAGDVQFIIRFYSTSDGLFQYVFNTHPCILNVHMGLKVDDETEKLYPTILMEWMEIVVKCKYLLENSDDIMSKFIELGNHYNITLEDWYSKIYKMIGEINWNDFIAQVNTHEMRLDLLEQYLFDMITANEHKMVFTHQQIFDYSSNSSVRRVIVTGSWNEALSRMEC